MGPWSGPAVQGWSQQRAPCRHAAALTRRVPDDQSHAREAEHRRQLAEAHLRVLVLHEHKVLCGRILLGLKDRVHL